MKQLRRSFRLRFYRSRCPPQARSTIVRPAPRWKQSTGAIGSPMPATVWPVCWRSPARGMRSASSPAAQRHRICLLFQMICHPCQPSASRWNWPISDRLRRFLRWRIISASICQHCEASADMKRARSENQAGFRISRVNSRFQAGSEGGVDIDNVNQLVVDEFSQAKIQQFAAITRTTNATKWQVGLRLGRMVHKHHAG